jgi:hypothetical protein
MALNKGEQAPNFTLFSSENKQVSWIQVINATVV